MAGLGNVRAVAASIAAMGALLACASAAQAQRPPSLGDGAPSGQSGIQLYNFNSYIQNGAGEIVCPDPPADPTPYCVPAPAPATQAARLERVFAFLQSQNINIVELYGYPGNPFPGTNSATPLNLPGLNALRALGNQYGIRFTGRHGNLNEPNWDNQITASKILGQDHIGEAGFPGGGGAYNTYQGALNTAQLLNRLGKRSVEAGLGPAYFHNHQPEFQTRHVDNGVLKSAWEIIMERTDPRWVSAQIDIGWAVCGAAGHVDPVDPAVGAAYVTAMINKFTNRIVSFHVKDMVNARPSCGNDDQRELGRGEIDFRPIFAAAKNRVKYYLAERDPVAVGGPTNFNPFVNTANSAAALKSAPAPVLYAYPPTFPSSVPVGTAAADSQVPVNVINDGDAPLTITNVQLQAEAADGGNQTRDDFQIVSQNCSGAGSVGPLAPGAQCVVNVGFRPSRTNYTSVARLQFTSDSDDAMERVLLAATSGGNAVKPISGTVPSVMMLSIPSAGASFGMFMPTLTRNYETAMAAVVTTTTGDAALSVSDPSTSFPGHLVNGAFALPQPINARAINASNPTQAFAPLAEATGTPTQLLTWDGPINQQPVTLGFRQGIGSGDVLRSGTYSKTLTFTLSTTAP
jgi:sugar phosphate isomerase/epimerase